MAAIPVWTREDHERFQSLLVHFPEGSPGVLENIAKILRKPVTEVSYYAALVNEDVVLIDSGKVLPLPSYPKDDYVSPTEDASQSTYKERKRKRPNHWSIIEHGLFLEGLNKCKKGDWRGISRDYVKTRTPTQVASHAQKYFIRQNDLKTKERKRWSIHDMTFKDVDSVAVVPGSSSLESMGQQQHFHVPDHLKDPLVPGSSGLESTVQQQHFAVQNPQPDYPCSSTSDLSDDEFEEFMIKESALFFKGL